MLSHFLKGLAVGGRQCYSRRGVAARLHSLPASTKRLIHAVGQVDLEALKMVFKGDIKEAWNRVDGTFLALVFAGVFVAILTIARLFKSITCQSST